MALRIEMPVAHHPPYRTGVAVACALVVAIVPHHPTADARQDDGAVSPAVSPDPAETRSRALRLDYSAAPIALRIALPPVDAASRNAAEEASRNRPPRIGFHRAMPSGFQDDLSSSIEWVPLDDGSVVGAVSVTSPEASAIRAGIRTDLTGGGEVRFFGGQGAQGHARQGSANRDLPVMTQADVHVEGGQPEILWSPVVEGDTIGIEITLPSGEVLSTFSFSIEKISHIHVPLGTLRYTPKALFCSNHIDVQCRVGRFPRNMENAVARIVYQADDGSYVCSGTLLNVTRDVGFIPYFLTANHCVSSAEVARTVDARWFYQQASCGGSTIDRRSSRTAGGADLLATSVSQDSTLLRFRRGLPGGLWYSGWRASAVSHPTDVYGIHHPDGGVKKYSAGSTRYSRDVQIDDFVVADAIHTDWREGTTEGGSSGSGLFDGEHLIGVLSGGPVDDDGNPLCEDALAVYGSFEDFFPRVRQWLDPEAPSRTDTLAMVPPASDRVNRGLVRIINRSNRRGTVRITAVDDTGRRFGPVSLPMSPRQTRHVTSAQLERGGAGLSGGVGDGAGSWRLVLTANLDIEALAYILAGDGSLSGMNALAAESRHGATWRYDVPYFQPASRGRLRLVNPGAGAARVTITGVDDRGAAGDGAVRMTVAAGAARNPTTEALEQGDDNLSGWLGDGTGRWRLTVSSNRQLLVMSLLRNPGGHLVNLSHGEASVSVEPPPPPPSFAPDLVVRSPSVSDDSLTAGQSFTLRATVHNQGGRRSVATRLLYYRSSDATISTADTRIGADAVAGLAPSGASPESIVSRAPSRAGTYHYGACVNPVSGESDTGNNCSSGVRVRVTAPASDDHGNTPSTATPVAIPSTTAGRIERSADRDYFRVVVRRTGTYQAETTGSTDTFGTLLASDGRTVLFLDDDSGAGNNFRMTGVVPAGTYFIEVRGFLGATGPYTLRVSRAGSG